ncbi:MAG TPA: endonuclease domain-containing protein [Xanthobacteraceae bacterium]|nr:endonuclease domain-containing protein [Xanthobacteraceae bacterium]
MSNTPRAQPGSSSLCKGEDRWRSAASRFSRTKETTARARRLRRDATRAERKPWYVLQRGQLDGLSFRRQHPVGRYILDFYCPAIRLAVEVDGGQHNEPRHHADDERRTQVLRNKGITVLRFWNNDVLENIEGVWYEISRIAVTLTLRPATPTPTLPLSGGGSSQ